MRPTIDGAKRPICPRCGLRWVERHQDGPRFRAVCGTCRRWKSRQAAEQPASADTCETCGKRPKTVQRQCGWCARRKPESPTWRERQDARRAYAAIDCATRELAEQAKLDKLRRPQEPFVPRIVQVKDRVFEVVWTGRESLDVLRRTG